MFSIAENIYSGWQYIISLVSLVGGNFHLVLDNISKFSDYVVNLLNNFPVPDWIALTLKSILGICVVSKICHWG